MAELIIGLDIDEVLAPFTAHFLIHYNLQNNTNFIREDIKQFELERTLGGTLQNMIDMIFGFYKTLEFIQMPAVAGSQNGTKILREQGFKLEAITSRPEKIDGLDLRELTLSWLELRFPSTLSEIHFTSEFVTNGHRVTKAEVCKKLGVQLFVEDRYGYAKGCALSGIRTFLYDSPWNRNKEMLENMERVHSWDEILTKV